MWRLLWVEECATYRHLTSHPSLVAVFSEIKPDLRNITIRISAFYLAILPFQLLWRDSHRRNVRIRNVVPPAPLHHRYINLRHVCVGKQRTEIRGEVWKLKFLLTLILKKYLIHNVRKRFEQLWWNGTGSARRTSWDKTRARWKKL